LSSKWKQAYRLLKDKNEAVWKLPQGMVYKQGIQRLTLVKSFSVRLIRIRLSSRVDEILLTNLYDGFSIDDLKELYAMRWQVEECYKRIKQVTQMEYFSGKTVESNVGRL
jgi:IS4 transposase